MSRINKINELLDAKTVSRFTEKLELTGFKGITASEIGKELGVARNSVSQDLNQLVVEGKAIKVKSRPVYFYSKKVLSKFISIELLASYDSIEKFNNALLIQKSMNIMDEKNNAFEQIIGHDGSLKKCVDQMKAAVLYPPNGLNMMVCGESGVGKTLIAESLHRFYDQHTYKETPFVYFNCAEYFNNPELLTSHLFGYKAGSFTGAETDRKGLVETANNGFLFLDEVHRLPSEGQEKLFTILDKGYYSRVGDLTTQKVNIRFIFATTENLEHTFLKTFLRRIPVTVTLPNLNERPIAEKVELIINFFQTESNRINKDIEISRAIIEYFVFIDYSGNVGEMKSDIQFICAQNYLKQMNQQEKILIGLSSKDEVTISKDAKDMLVLNKLLPIEAIVIKNGNDVNQRENYFRKDFIEEDMFYRFLLREYSNLKNSNIPETQAAFILEKKLEQLNDMQLFDDDSEIIKNWSRELDENFSKKLELLYQYVEEVVDSPLDEKLRAIISKHIYATLLFMETPNDDFYDYSSQLMLGKLENYNEAKEIVDYISNLFNREIPKTEITYFGLLLRKLKQESCNQGENKECGIVVVAHGETTATSMVEYCNTLFTTNLLQAINMPIYQSVEDTLDKLRKTIKEHHYKRLILLVDIGSLVYFGNLISEEFEIEVLLIKNINLLTLLELSREMLYETTDFDYLLPIMNEKNHATSICKVGQFTDRRVLIVSCMTGLGTAIKIEKLLVESFKNDILANIRIVTVENKEIQSIEKIHQYVFPDERLVGIVGNMPTEIPDIPFISLEELFSERGVERLLLLFGFDLTLEENKLIEKQISERYMQMLSIEAITNYIKVLNPQRLTVEVKEVYMNLASQLKLTNSDKKMLRFLIHCCCTVERLVIDNTYNMNEYEVSYKDMPDEASVIKMSLRPIEVSYRIQFSPLEIKYIYELLYG